MTAPLAEISEKNASGTVAAIYADIRNATGLPLVNLIFRHMATIPGCLEWAWDSLRPLYTHGAIYEAADRIAATIPLEKDDTPRPWRKDRVVADTLESYTRGNMLNMIGLFLLLRAGASDKGKLGDAFVPRAITHIMPLPDLTSLPTDAAQRLKSLARLTEGESPLIPSLFRHFADWPEAVAAIEKIVHGLTENGRLTKLAAAMNDAGRTAALHLRAPSTVDDAIARKVEKLTALFTPTMARMTILATAMAQR